MLRYELRKRPGHPLYEELYAALKNDIVTGALSAGERLPSKRQLARDAGVSLTTVQNAYEQLVTEGYATSEERRGYFAADIQPVPAPTAEPPSRQRVLYEETKWFADFRSNNTLYHYFPYATWKKVIRQVLSERDAELVVRGHPFGIRELREQIAAYLYRSRGIVTSPECIVVGAGIEYLYTRLIALLDPDAVYGMENPGYLKIPRIYAANKLRWRPVDMEADGLSLADLRAQDVDIVHVSPEHHYPLGTTMPMERRQELLRWAAEDGERYIIEDDYDCEFRYDSHPIPALRSLDANGRVIYMNTFSKTLSPAVRVSYMVLPAKLMGRYLEKMQFFTNSTSSLEQYALARFIEEGYFERHLNRIKKRYRQEGETLRRLILESPSIPMKRLSAAKSGTHLLVQLDTEMSDAQVKRRAAARGVNLACVSDYCAPGKRSYPHTLILNFSDLDEETQREGIRRLGEVFG